MAEVFMWVSEGGSPQGLEEFRFQNCNVGLCPEVLLLLSMAVHAYKPSTARTAAEGLSKL